MKLNNNYLNRYIETSICSTRKSNTLRSSVADLGVGQWVHRLSPSLTLGDQLINIIRIGDGLRTFDVLLILSLQHNDHSSKFLLLC